MRSCGGGSKGYMSVTRRVDDLGRARVESEVMYVSRRSGGRAHRKLLFSIRRDEPPTVTARVTGGEGWKICGMVRRTYSPVARPIAH